MRTKSKIIFGTITFAISAIALSSVAIAIVGKNDNKVDNKIKKEVIDLKEFKLNVKSGINYDNFFKNILYKPEFKYNEYFDLNSNLSNNEKLIIQPLAKCYDTNDYIRTVELNITSDDPNIEFKDGVKSIYFNILIQSKINENSKLFNKMNHTLSIPTEIDAITDNILSNQQINIKHYEFIDYTNSKLQIINNHAFSTLENIEILDFSQHKNLKVINGASFVGMPNLKTIILPDTIEYFQYGFKDCKNLKQFDIPNNWKEIKFDYFSNCVNLWSDSKCIIPDSINHIDDNSFIDINFKKGIYFPATFTTDPAYYTKIGIKDLSQVYVGGQKLTI